MRVPSPCRDSICSWPPISSARSRMNWSPKLRLGPRGEPHQVEPATVVGDHEGVSLETDGDLAGRRVLANVLECLLDDAQDRCAGRVGVRRSSMPSTDTSTAIPCRSSSCRARSAMRRRQPDVDDRRPQVGDEGADLVEAVAQHVAQERELGVRDGSIGSSSMRSRYSTWKMALVSTCAGPSWMSSAMRCRSPSWACDDAQAHGGRRVVGHRAGLVARLVGRLEVAPQQVELAGDDVEPLQPGLECGQLSAALLVLGAKRIGPDRAERSRRGGRAARGAASTPRGRAGTARGTARPARACDASRHGGSPWPRRRCGRTARWPCPRAGSFAMVSP